MYTHVCIWTYKYMNRYVNKMNKCMNCCTHTYIYRLYHIHTCYICVHGEIILRSLSPFLTSEPIWFWNHTLVHFLLSRTWRRRELDAFTSQAATWAKPWQIHDLEPRRGFVFTSRKSHPKTSEAPKHLQFLYLFIVASAVLLSRLHVGARVTCITQVPPDIQWYPEHNWNIGKASQNFQSRT